MTEKSILEKINIWLKDYSDYVDSREIKEIIEKENNTYELVFYDKRIAGNTLMGIEELPFNKNITEATNLKFGEPYISKDSVFYNYCFPIPYSYEYLLKNPKGRGLNVFASYGIYAFKNNIRRGIKIPCSKFDDFNSLFAPAIESFVFNNKRKQEFLNLIEELNTLKNEIPKIYMILNHQGTPVDGFFIMLLEYIDKLYLLQIVNNS